MQYTWILFVGWLVGAMDVPLNGYVTLSKLMKHPGSVSGPVRGRRLSVPGRVVTGANSTVGERLTVLATLYSPRLQSKNTSARC